MRIRIPPRIITTHKMTQKTAMNHVHGFVWCGDGYIRFCSLDGCP